jgi:hypothetical protein
VVTTKDEGETDMDEQQTTTENEWALTTARPSYTKWTNPCGHSQRLVFVGEGEPKTRAAADASGTVRTWTEPTDRIVEIPAGATMQIPSKYDAAIHKVQCDHADCNKRPGFCKRPADAGPASYVLCGMAPLLHREDQRYVVHPSLLGEPEPARTMMLPPAPGAKLLTAGGTAAVDLDDPAMARARARRAKAGAR